MCVVDKVGLRHNSRGVAYIRKVQSSKVCRHTCPEWGLSWFPPKYLKNTTRFLK